MAKRLTPPELAHARKLLLDVVDRTKDQRKAAAELGVSPSMVNEAISGSRGVGPKLIDALAKHYGIGTFEVRGQRSVSLTTEMPQGLVDFLKTTDGKWTEQEIRAASGYEFATPPSPHIWGEILAGVRLIHRRAEVQIEAERLGLAPESMTLQKGALRSVSEEPAPKAKAKKVRKR